MAQSVYLIDDEIEIEVNEIKKKIPAFYKDINIRGSEPVLVGIFDGKKVWQVYTDINGVEELKKTNKFYANNIFELFILSPEIGKTIAKVTYREDVFNNEIKEYIETNKTATFNEWINMGRPSKKGTYIRIDSPGIIFQ